MKCRILFKFTRMLSTVYENWYEFVMDLHMTCLLLLITSNCNGVIFTVVIVCNCN